MVQGFLPHLSKWKDGITPLDSSAQTDPVQIRYNRENKQGGTVLNILSTAATVPMTASAAYQASKGAASILTLQLARELMNRHGVVVFGISPNKLAGTGMSNQVDARVAEVRGWTPEYTKQYSDSNILCGEETDPRVLGEFIAYLLSSPERHRHLAGTIIPYGYQR